MNLRKIKSNIDTLFKENKNNWIDHVFSSNLEMCKSLRDKQFYKAMIIMASINIKCPTLKEPEVKTSQEGWDLRFEWTFDNQYYLKLSVMVPWEGKLHYEINTFKDGDPEGPMCYGNWKYKDFYEVDGPEIDDFIGHLEGAVERESHAKKTAK